MVIMNNAIPCFCFCLGGRKLKEEKLVKFLAFLNDFLVEPGSEKFYCRDWKKRKQEIEAVFKIIVSKLSCLTNI